MAHVNQELINYYQPIVDLQTGKTAGFEMLLRWFDNGQYISPDEFIPIAEKVGLIVDITMLSLERVVTDLSLWYSQGFSGYVNINLSAKHFATRPKFEQILRLLAKYNIPVTAIRFEITETLLVENNKNTLDYMNEMSDLGFKICLDDYGTGYSSPKYLKDFPIDVLKIDKSFVDDVVSDTATASIIHSTLMMTELLALDTVAEGIERQEQVKYFKQTSCRYLQGYYFAKPVVVEECLDMLDKHWDC